jgi:short-subunit dehydrogenase
VLGGKTVLITGASAGIGAAVARELAAHGCNLVLTARRLELLEALAAELAPRAKVLPLAADVTRDGEIEAAVAAAERTFGALDIVIANAGFAVTGRLDRLSLDDHRRQLETNLFGVLRTVYAALPALKRARGQIALMGSIAGHVPTPATGPYNMSKFALRAFAEVLHDELRAEGVAVTLLSPGFVVSDIGRVDNQGRRHEVDGSRIPAWLRMPTDEAARQIVDAIASHRREALITAHGKLGVFFYRHFPWLVRAVVAKMAPAPRARGARS